MRRVLPDAAKDPFAASDIDHVEFERRIAVHTDERSERIRTPIERPDAVGERTVEAIPVRLQYGRADRRIAGAPVIVLDESPLPIGRASSVDWSNDWFSARELRDTQFNVRVGSQAVSLSL